MNCAECEVLLHALIDGELDAGHAATSRRTWRLVSAAPRS